MKRSKYIRPANEEKQLMIELSSKLKYNSNTGQFIWLEPVRKATKSGDPAGCPDERGYINIIFRGKKFKAHRLAWFISTGKIPGNCIDHINGNKSDNRMKNLRIVDELLNQQNRPSHRKGILWGTHFHRASNSFGSRVNYKGKIVSLGYFKTREEAHNRSLRFAKDKGIPILGRELLNEHTLCGQRFPER